MCCFSTCSSLKSVNSFVYASRCRAVLPCSDLCVQSTDVEQHTSFLEGQRTLTRRDACQRVVPVGERREGISSLSDTQTGGINCPINQLFFTVQYIYIQFSIIFALTSDLKLNHNQCSHLLQLQLVQRDISQVDISKYTRSDLLNHLPRCSGSHLTTYL